MCFFTGPRSSTNNNLSYLFNLASDQLLNHMYSISCAEVAGFLSFADSGVDNPCLTFDVERRER